MILFLEDWKNYPTAIIDVETKNRSFVRLASVYRSMGVKNHAFLLALVNPALQGVDPFDPNLTPEQALAIGLECKVNPWYFFREIARAPGESGDDAVMMEANRANISLFWSFFNHATYLLIQPRQTGKSFSTDVLMRYLMNIKCRDTKFNLLTKDDILRRKNIERLKAIGDELPAYLNVKTGADANNGEEITVRALGNFYNTHVPQNSEKAAYKLGRGLTTAVVHIDEPPFQPHIKTAMPAMLAAMSAAVDRAKAAGAPYGVIMTTTAGQKDDKDGKYIYNEMMAMARWTERFLDAENIVELERMVRGSSREKIFAIVGEFDHRQLGKTDEWLREKIEKSRAKGEDADRDFFNIWTSGTASSPFSPAQAESIAKSKMAELHVSISNPDAYITRWYVPEEEIERIMANDQFTLGIDSSDASGGDDISFVLTSLTTLKTVAVGTYNETNLIKFAMWICSFLVKYKNVTANIERRSTGAMILDYLLLMLPEHGEDPFKRLFNRIVHDYDEFPDRYHEINRPMNRRDPSVYVRYKKHFGFATSGSGVTSRSELYSTVLQNAVKRSADRIYDKPLIDQILGLVIRNGRVDHEVGSHDDLVIGWLLNHWLVQQGKNLGFYGIDIGKMASEVVERKKLSYEEMIQKAEQEEIRERIEELYEQIVGEDDDYLSTRLEMELRRLDRKLILEEGDIYSVDELMKKARDSKRDRIRSSMQSYQTNQYGFVQRPVTSSSMHMSDSPLRGARAHYR